MSYKVFFSYSVQDSAWIEWLAQSLQKVEIEPYMFQYDLQPGQYVAEKVKKNIEACDCFVVLISQASSFSQYVNQEIGVAEGKNKLVVPLVEVGIDSKRLGMLEGREYVSFDKRDPYFTQSKIIEYLSKKKASKELQESVALGILAALIIIAILGRE